MSSATDTYQDRSNERRPLNLRETVLERLQTAIVTGELSEGEMVSAPSLGQKMGVSATPVREAMMDLVREGLVETVKNKGFRVTGMSDKDLDDLTEVRLLLEPSALRLVAKNIPESAFEELVALADTCLEAAQRGDVSEYLRSDREFHTLILSYTGNEQLVELSTSLRRRTRFYGIETLAKDGRLANSAQEHHELLDLLRKGDAAGAEQLMHSHIKRSRELSPAQSDEEVARVVAES